MMPSGNLASQGLDAVVPSQLPPIGHIPACGSALSVRELLRLAPFSDVLGGEVMCLLETRVGSILGWLQRLLLITIGAILLAPGCADQRTSQPQDSGKQSDLNGSAVTQDFRTGIPITSSSIMLYWNATGDNGKGGAAAYYEIRYSESAETIWDEMTQVRRVPKPKPAGQAQTCLVNGLQADRTYYFRIRTADAAMVWSDVSAPATGTTTDRTAPARIGELVADPQPGYVDLAWKATGDDDSSGWALRYDIRYTTTSDTTWGTMHRLPDDPDARPAGRSERFRLTGLEPGRPHIFKVRLGDDAGNWSPPSPPLTVTPAPPYGAWSGLGVGQTPNGSVTAILPVSGTGLAVGGAFTALGERPVSHIALWNTGTWEWTPVGKGLDDQVDALATYNGDLIAGGRFYMADSTTAVGYIARWDGLAWQPLGGGMGGPVRALTVYNGKLIAAGEFTYAGLASALHVASWDGAAWDTLASGLDGNVDCLCVYQNLLIAGGRFAVRGVDEIQSIASFDGTEWRAIGEGLANGVVLSVASVADTTLVAGGTFQGTTSTPKLVARWNGEHWIAMGKGVSAPVGRGCLTLYNGGLFVGGKFNSAGGRSINFLARYDAGDVWTPVGLGLDRPVTSLAVFDGSLIIGGAFHTAGGQKLPYIASWTHN
jgi:hypothetical protein